MHRKRTDFRFSPGAFLLASLMVFGVNVEKAAADQTGSPAVIPPDPARVALQASVPMGDGKALRERESVAPEPSAEQETAGGSRPGSVAPVAPERPTRTAGPATNWWSWTGQAPLRHSPLQTLTGRAEANAASPRTEEHQRIPGPCCRSVPISVQDTASNLI